MITKYEFFRQNLKHLIQNSDLDIGIAYFILKDTFKEIEDLYYAALNNETLSIQEDNHNSKHLNKPESTDKAEE